MARSAYKCDINLSYILDNEETKIDQNFVKYIVIDNMYESKSMPVIYISIAVTNELYSLMVENEKSGKVYLRINRRNVYSNSSLSIKYIEGQFSYMCSTSNPNYSQSLDDSSMDSAYKIITIALISMDIINKLSNSFNGIYGEIDSATLLAKAVEDLDCVVKPIIYNPKYETLVIPAMNNKISLIKFLFDECPFYDTNYMFFTDFNRSYILDLTGEYCEARDGQLESVYFDIQELTTAESYYEGMQERDGVYYINVNPADTNVSENKGEDKDANQLVTISSGGNIEFVDIDVGQSEESEVRQRFKRGTNATLYKNIQESNTVIIELVKENIDSTVITPNKEYVVKNYADYADYNGKYTLLYKKDIITNVHGEFGISVTLGLRKVGNISHIGSGVVKEAIRRHKSAIGRYKMNTKETTTTARKSNNGGTATPRPKASTHNVNASSTKSMKIPTVKRMKAVTDQSIRRDITKI